MVADHLERVKARISQAATRVGREPDEVTLVAVSKARSVAEIREAYEAGHRDFGENRPEEMAAKASALPHDVRWHFVGTLQRRRIAQVRSVAALLHSMDRDALSSRWIDADGNAPPCLLQVNIGGEDQKHGVPYQGALKALDAMAEHGVYPVGLMVIPPAPAQPEDSRVHFADLAALCGSLRGEHPELVQLSMGMTDDFEVAVEEGATLVRVGRAIFGSELVD
jgi:pyridoxal phosphate enzyme (YggS family)